MSFFVNPSPITKPLDDEHKVTFRKLSYGERQRLTSKCMTFNPITQDMDIDYARFTLEALKMRLVAWEGPEFDGAPCNAENIDRLSIEAADRIATVVDGKDEVLSDDEKKA
jgi:hypothetical protein